MGGKLVFHSPFYYEKARSGVQKRALKQMTNHPDGQGNTDGCKKISGEVTTGLLDRVSGSGKNAGELNR